MAVFQIGRQAIKPTAIGEITGGIQAFQAARRATEQRNLQQEQQRAQIELVKSQTSRQQELLRQLQSQLSRPTTIPEGFEPSGITVGPKGGVSQRFAPPKKPKVFDITELNDLLFQATHTKKDKKTVEIEPDINDIRALKIAAEQSGFELRKIPKTFARVGIFGKIEPATFTYRLVPKKKAITKKPTSKIPSKAARRGIDVKSLTDEQLDAIIGSR